MRVRCALEWGDRGACSPAFVPCKLPCCLLCRAAGERALCKRLEKQIQRADVDREPLIGSDHTYTFPDKARGMHANTDVGSMSVLV